jgi:alginate O-acetyltransferase complex protein AlgI
LRRAAQEKDKDQYGRLHVSLNYPGKMLFSSTLFLFYFLPIFFLFYFLVPGIKFKNAVLLLFSFIFFAWGGISFTAILILSICFNYVMGLLIERQYSKIPLYVAVCGNLLLLIFFKYFNFLLANINLAFTNPIQFDNVILPIGISFYTFHSISYILDVYHKRSRAQTNILDMALYIVLFTQLIAGPIIRYNIFSPQLHKRLIDPEKIATGIERFIIGLGKKVLIANTLGRIADDAFSQEMGHMDPLLSSLGILCYTFQIYFDFSGYSDMAIGLSRMIGFNFPENFNLPYTATSIKDFWRRWHISLSTFFRDYLYIPLGGNKKGRSRTLINLLIVFFLTGLWHGANYTFIVWGLLHGGFLLLERAGLEGLLKRTPIALQRSYAFAIVMLIWIPFRANTSSYAWYYFTSMFSLNGNWLLIQSYFTTDVIIALGIAVLASFGFFRSLDTFIKQKLSSTLFQKTLTALNYSFLLFVLFLSSVYLASLTYNPFIYYQF